MGDVVETHCVAEIFRRSSSVHNTLHRGVPYLVAYSTACLPCCLSDLQLSAWLGSRCRKGSTEMAQERCGTWSSSNHQMTEYWLHVVGLSRSIVLHAVEVA